MELAGLFMKRVCIFGTPVPGNGPGHTTVPTSCEVEPTLVLVMLVAGGVLLTLIVVAALLFRRRGPRAESAAFVPAVVAAPGLVPGPVVAAQASVHDPVSALDPV